MMEEAGQITLDDFLVTCPCIPLLPTSSSIGNRNTLNEPHLHLTSRYLLECVLFVNV